jgi:hypothetical protein
LKLKLVKQFYCLGELKTAIWLKVLSIQFREVGAIVVVTWHGGSYYIIQNGGSPDENKINNFSDPDL